MNTPILSRLLLIAAVIVAFAAFVIAADFNETEPNDTPAQANIVSGTFFTLEYRPYIGNVALNTSLRIPAATIWTNPSGNPDFFAFTADAGDRIIVDADFGDYGFWGAYLTLSFSGTSVASSIGDPIYPDEAGQTGDGGNELAYLQYTATTSGTYVLQVTSLYGGVTASPLGVNVSVGPATVPFIQPGEPLVMRSLQYSVLGYGVPAVMDDGLMACLIKAKLQTNPAGPLSGLAVVTGSDDSMIVAGIQTGPGGRFGSSGGLGSSASGSGLIEAGPRIIAREGTLENPYAASAGTGDDRFVRFLDPVYAQGTYGGTERVAFIGYLARTGTVTATNDSGIWINDRGFNNRIAREGDPAPGYPGAKFTAFTYLGLSEYPGGVVFQASVSGTDGTALPASANSGIWATDLDENLTLVAREGGTIVVGGTARTISTLGIFASSAQTRPNSRSASGNGTVVYRARFTDGTQGVYSWSP